MKVIIPCAGKSSRFPNTRPKYLLTMPDGRMMLQHAADNYIKRGDDVTFVVVKQHCDEYQSEYAIRKAYGDAVNIVKFDEFTSGPAETVYKVVSEWNEDSPFAVNDCDGFFDFTNANSNYVVYVDLVNYPNISQICAKSFIKIENSVVSDIIEKQVSSQYICVGGYGFSSSSKFIQSYARLKNSHIGEMYLSHVIKDMIDVGEVFSSVEGSNYIDCGTYETYSQNMRNHMAIFCDIDGIIFKNQSRYFKNGHDTPPILNQSAIDFLKEKIKLGATVIFTTARSEDVREVTERAIREAGIHDFRIIYGLPHAPRLLINDVHFSNPWPAASAINAPRNDNDFWKMFT